MARAAADSRSTSDRIVRSLKGCDPIAPTREGGRVHSGHTRQHSTSRLADVGRGDSNMDLTVRTKLLIANEQERKYTVEY